LQNALNEIKAHRSEFELAQEEERDLPSMSELLDDFQSGWENMVQTIVDNSDNPGGQEVVDEAVYGFSTLWEEKQSYMELALAGSSSELINRTLSELVEHETEQRLIEGKQKIASGIAKLENLKLEDGKLSPKATEYYRRLKMLSNLTDEAKDLIEQFKSAKPTDDISELHELKNRLRSKLEDLDRAERELNTLPIPGDSIFIEAENESYTELLPHTACWHSHKELNNPAWRPPLSGGGLWYFSRAPEMLGYHFAVKESGDYVIWLRDIASLDWPPGARSVSIIVDGKSYGSFSEHPNRTPYPPGTFAWHPTASVTLTAGQHTLELKKESDTGAAALLDAIYITNNFTEVPE
ncbi:MAG: hypothetical protein J7L90_03875, partial [Dehalococcoidia bacterium]|nr:hypothetical protein [Dehalococcoidia bacterium]